MALNAQQNWNVSMAENLEQTMRKKNDTVMKPQSRVVAGVEKAKGRDNTRTSHEESESEGNPVEPVYLPDEIIVQILDYTSRQSAAQPTLAACCLLSHQWYSTAIPLLYRRPHLYGNNFDLFVRAICPSINLHVRKSPLSELVKVLDMSRLVHQGSKSLTARLLGRTKATLEEFIAPQASFAVNCLPALSKCHRLHLLDLSLVSESPPLPDLFRSTSHLRDLHTLRLPRSSGFGVHHSRSSFPSITWPSSLQSLNLSGGIDAHFLHGIVAFPPTLRSLTIEHCPNAKAFAVTHLLKTAVRPLSRLQSLKIRHMPRLGSCALDNILFLLPQITRLSVSVDYITPALFDENHFHHSRNTLSIATSDFELDIQSNTEPLSSSLSISNLRTLELTNSSGSSGNEDKITPIDIMIALDEDSIPSTVPKLRQVIVARSLLWQASSTREDVEALADALQEASRRDWEARDGVLNEREAGEAEGWREGSGVWIVDG